MVLSGLCTPDCTVSHFSIYYVWSKNCSIKCHSSSNLECKDLQEGAYLTLIFSLWHFRKHLYGYFLLLLSPEYFMFLEMRFKNFSSIKNVFLENRKLFNRFGNVTAVWAHIFLMIISATPDYLLVIKDLDLSLFICSTSVLNS